MRRRALILAAPLPVFIFAAYGLLRLLHIQPEVESGMSEFMSTAFLIAASTLCYFTGILRGLREGTRAYLPWLAAASLMLLLGLDETFMIHEVLHAYVGIPEHFTLVFYFVLLVVVLGMLRRFITRDSVVLLALFFLLSGVAFAADTFLGEGTIAIAGRTIDYEQILEAVAALLLCSAFGVMAARD